MSSSASHSNPSTQSSTTSATTLGPRFITGYYGFVDADNRIRATKVHVRRAGEYGPACGARLNPQMSFHFCASGVERSYLTCKRCEKLTAPAEPGPLA